MLLLIHRVKLRLYQTANPHFARYAPEFSQIWRQKVAELLFKKDNLSLGVIG